MQIDSIQTPQPPSMPPRRSPGRPRLGTVLLALLGAMVAMCLVQLACRSGVTTARGNGVRVTPKAAQRVISVDGTARLDIAPDRVDLHITLSQDGKTPRLAAEAVGRQRKGLITALKWLRLSDKHIVISHLNLSPRYAQYRRSITGYTASITFIAKLQNPEKLTGFVQAAASAGASRLTTHFRSSRMQEMKRKVREMALKAARLKAAQIATATGVQVGQLRTVSESSHGNWTGSRWGWGGANSVANAMSSVRGSGGGPARPDAIRLHLSVAVSYAIR